MDILTSNEVFSKGLEFTNEVCFSGEYGQQVYTKPMEEGGIPYEGILYETYPNGELNYYGYYKEGIAHGASVTYYDTGEIKSYCIMDMGAVDGIQTAWYKSGNVKLERYSKYGLVFYKKRYDETGICYVEKEALTEAEVSIYEKFKKIYEK